MRAATLICTLLALVLVPLVAQAFETTAKSAIVYDVATGQTLMEKNADMALPPASMSKLMTLNMVFEALDDGRMTLDEEIVVSSAASAYGGSTMFLQAGDRVSVEDLIRGVIVLSGNDASTALGEAIAGSEPAFAQMMTDRALELDMTNSTFANANGWPAARQRMSVRDLATLANRLITVFPQYYGYFAETEFQFKDSPPANRFNRNPLLKLNIGADGLKTGHTEEAGYGLVGSAKQGNRRIIFVLTGLGSEKDRAEESERITNWAFRQFAERKVAEKGVVLTQADVWMGEAASVGLATTADVMALLPVIGRENAEAKISYVGPFDAPISAGDKLGELIVSVPGLGDTTHPLVAVRDVPKGGFLVRIRTAATVLLGQLTGQALTFF